MAKSVTFSLSKTDGAALKKLAAKLGMPQADIFRTCIKHVLKMKVAEQKAFFKIK